MTRNPDKTRTALLSAAYQEIFQHGFQAASLKNILDTTNVTKGALYHHFPSKQEMGYAIVDNNIKSLITETWIKPLHQSDDVIAVLLAQIDRCIAEHDDQTITLGCPLNNLAQEMSPIDEGFRQRINDIFDQWRQAIATAIEHGQKQGMVRKDANAEAAAYFILASLEGSVSLAKNAKSVAVLNTSLQELGKYIESLREI